MRAKLKIIAWFKTRTIFLDWNFILKNLWKWIFVELFDFTLTYKVQKRYIRISNRIEPFERLILVNETSVSDPLLWERHQLKGSKQNLDMGGIFETNTKVKRWEALHNWTPKWPTHYPRGLKFRNNPIEVKTLKIGCPMLSRKTTVILTQTTWFFKHQQTSTKQPKLFSRIRRCKSINSAKKPKRHPPKTIKNNDDAGDSGVGELTACFRTQTEPGFALIFEELGNLMGQSNQSSTWVP